MNEAFWKAVHRAFEIAGNVPYVTVKYFGTDYTVRRNGDAYAVAY